MYEKILKNSLKVLNLENQIILLQLPEGLWIYVKEVIRILEVKGNKVYWYSGRSYGACDLPVEEAKRLGCNMILHVGHAPFLKQKEIEGIKVEYVELFIDYNIQKNPLV